MAKKPKRQKKSRKKPTPPKPASKSRVQRKRAPRVPAGALNPRRAARIARVAAAAAEATCLEMPAAVALVRGCLGGTLPDLGTKLGDLRPDPDDRAQFCQCVADGAGVSRAQIPCGEGTTVGEVIDAIAC